MSVDSFRYAGDRMPVLVPVLHSAGVWVAHQGPGVGGPLHISHRPTGLLAAQHYDRAAACKIVDCLADYAAEWGADRPFGVKPDRDDPEVVLLGVAVEAAMMAAIIDSDALAAFFAAVARMLGVSS